MSHDHDPRTKIVDGAHASVGSSQYGRLPKLFAGEYHRAAAVGVSWETLEVLKAGPAPVELRRQNQEEPTRLDDTDESREHDKRYEASFDAAMLAFRGPRGEILALEPKTRSLWMVPPAYALEHRQWYAPAAQEAQDALEASAAGATVARQKAIEGADAEKDSQS